MNTKKLFDAAAAAGITTFEARITTESKLSISTFDGELENYTVADNGAFKVRGLAGGKCGVFTSDRADDGVIDTAVAAVKESAEFGQPVDPEFFIGGGAYKYEKAHMFDAELAKVPAQEFISIAKEISTAAKSADRRIESVEVQVEYMYNSVELMNSNGLKLKDETNYCMIFASAKAVDGGEPENGTHYEILSSIDGFDCKAFAKELVRRATGQLGGETVKSGKYDIVFAPDCVAALMTVVVNGFSAFDVEQHVSLMEGKIGENIFSDSLSIEQAPIGSEPFCRTFDDEGVPCKNRLLVDKGVPTGYVYDLATAKRAGCESTGNGALRGGNVRPEVQFAVVLPGETSRDGLFAAAGSGIYITDLHGVATGLNPQSGAYSLQANGYVIENGKLGKPVSLITVAGNVMTDFADIIAVGSDSKSTYYGVKTPSIAVRGLNISGK